MIHNEFLQTLANFNTVPILMIVFLLFFLRANWRYEVEQTKQFMPPTLLLMILVLLDNFDFYGFTDNQFGDVTQFLHRVVGMLQYDVRILIMAFLLSIVSSRLSDNSKRTRFRTLLPAFVNVVVLFPCLFTDWFFMYDEVGHIIRGPFHFEPHLLSAAYILFLYSMAFMTKKRGRLTEFGILLITATSVVIAVLVEMMFELRGILLAVIGMSIMGYYIYLHIEHFRYDNLTGVLNREAFKVDIEKYGNRTVSHIMSIDMNGLKNINDTYGHEAGDDALQAVSAALSSVMSKNYRLYRIGGDEFAAVCMNRSNIEVKRLVEDMYEKVALTGYSCAIGYTAWTDDKSFMEVYKVADDAMYKKKRSMKEKLV